ncbi:MAG: spondin domain-containing protein [Nitrosopumilus sp.]|nr:spondin domain-containing protein [Nitrosopumilus sp.]MDA7958912.1 spondin domain-containing protein [Nitrosopumilus sp.]
MRTRTAGILAAVAATVVLAALTVPESAASGHRTYEVTITNLMPGQPITPPLLVTHAKDVGIFKVGSEASPELRQLAENGNAGPLVASIEGADGVHSIVQGDGPLVPANDPGQTGAGHTAVFTVEAQGRMGYLSFASMLVCTNDGFAGIDTVRLPAGEKTVYAIAHDARTEANTEDFADMVPPCQDAIGVSTDDAGTGESSEETAEDGVVIPHPGILGTADLLEEVHGWTDPAVRIDIVRTG